jgi:hypothetical protein
MFSYYWERRTISPDEIVFSFDSDEIPYYGTIWSYEFNDKFIKLNPQYSIREKLCTNIKNDINACFPNLLLKSVTYSNREYSATFACDEKFVKCAYYSSAILAILNAAAKFNIFASEDATPSLYLYTNQYAGDYIKILQNWAQSEECNFNRHFTNTNTGTEGLKFFIERLCKGNPYQQYGYNKTHCGLNDVVYINFPIDKEASLLLMEKINNFSYYFKDLFNIVDNGSNVTLLKKDNVRLDNFLSGTFYLYSLALYNNMDISCSRNLYEYYNPIGLYNGGQYV